MTATLITGPTRLVPQRQRAWRSYAIGVIALGLMSAGSGGWDIVHAIQVATHGVATQARLIGITVVPEGRGRVSHYARVHYPVAGGKRIVATSEDPIVSANHKIGDTLRVTYLSTDPERVWLADAGAIDGRSWLLLIVGIGTSLTGLFSLQRLRRQP